MPSVISHIAVPLAIKLGFRTNLISGRLLLLAVCCSMLPDLDVIGFKLGVPYSSQWGHRGFTHSIGFALMLGFVAALFNQQLKSRGWIIFCMISVVTFSHALLDSATNGGLGCALFWPFLDTRYFLPWTPIVVSPLSLSRFFTSSGLAVLASEFVWVWLPAAILALIIYLSKVIVTGLIATIAGRFKTTMNTAIFDIEHLLQKFANLLEIATITTTHADKYKSQDKLVEKFRNDMTPFMATMPLRHRFRCEQCSTEQGEAIHHLENPNMESREQNPDSMWGEPAGIFVSINASQLHQIRAHGAELPKEFEELFKSLTARKV